MNNPIDNFPSAKYEIERAKFHFDHDSTPFNIWYHLALAFLNLFAELVNSFNEAIPYLSDSMRGH